MLIRLALALLLASPAHAAEPPYLTGQQVPMSILLAPFPAPGSPQDAAEMDELMAIERSRTAERTALAQADVAETVFDMFASTLGPRFAPAALPAASRLFTRLEETEDAVLKDPKATFARPRPFMTNPALHPAAFLSRSGSYPSGHATRVRLMAIVLAAMLPEQRGPIFARAAEYAESRLVVGVHHRSDIVAGAQAGTAIAAVLLGDPAFKADYEPARAELRKAMGVE